MAVLFKVPPTPIDGDIVSVTAPRFGVVTLSPGDRVFLWWSEAQGGRGLAGHGLCVSADQEPGPLRAEVEPITLACCGFGRAQLRPFRDTPGASPEATLATKLYAHAHIKAVAISAAEEAFLDAVIARATPR
jgi:hypothetical protein